MMIEEFEASELGGKMRALQETCHSATAVILADMLAFIALSEQSLDLELQVKKRERALVKMEFNFQVASSAVLSAQYNSLAKE